MQNTARCAVTEHNELQELRVGAQNVLLQAANPAPRPETPHAVVMSHGTMKVAVVHRMVQLAISCLSIGITVVSLVAIHQRWHSTDAEETVRVCVCVRVRVCVCGTPGHIACLFACLPVFSTI